MKRQKENRRIIKNFLENIYIVKMHKKINK